MHKEEVLEQKHLYKGKILSLRLDKVLLENQKEAFREVVEHNGGVGIVALDENENVFLVLQYRHPYQKEVLEIPAGKRDGDEDPLICAKRELKEEIGAVAKSWSCLGELYPTPGYVGEVIHLFLAKELSFSAQNPDEDEFLTVVKMPLKEAVERVLDNRLPDAKTQTALLKAFLQSGKSKGK